MKPIFRAHIVKGNPSWENAEILQTLPIRISPDKNLSIDFKEPVIVEAHKQYYLEIHWK